MYIYKKSRQNHDNGRKHKEIVRLYLKDVQKRKKEKDLEEEETKRLLQKIERDAYKQYTKDRTEYPSLVTEEVKVNFSRELKEKPWLESTKEKEEKEDNKDKDKKEEKEEPSPSKKEDKDKKEETPLIDEDTGLGLWTVVETPVEAQYTPEEDAATKATTDNTFHAKESSYSTSIPIFNDEEKDIDNLENFKIQEKTLVIEEDDDNDIQKKPSTMFKKRKASKKDNKKKRTTRIRLE